MSGTTPLQLLVDIKTDGVEALPFILDALDPLRCAHFGSLVTSETHLSPQVNVVTCLHSLTVPSTLAQC